MLTPLCTVKFHQNVKKVVMIYILYKKIWSPTAVMTVSIL